MIAITTDNSTIRDLAGNPAQGRILLTPSTEFSYYDGGEWIIVPQSSQEFAIVDGKFNPPVIVAPTSGAGQSVPVFYQVIFDLTDGAPSRWTECWVVDAAQGPSIDQSKIMRVNIPDVPEIVLSQHTQPVNPADSTPISEQAIYPTGELIAADRVVVIRAGVAYVADLTRTADSDLLHGVARHNADSGAQLLVQHFGPMTESTWAWTPDLAIYLGAGGMMAQTPPIFGYSKVIAAPTAPNSIYIEQRSAIIL